MKRNIAVFVKNLTSGGAEKQSVILARVLAQEHSVCYIVFNGRKVHEKYLASLKAERRIRIHILRGGILQRLIGLYRILKQESIEFVFSYLTMANLIVSVIGKMTKTSVYSSLRNARLPWPKMAVDRFVCNHLAYKTISNSHSAKQHFVKKAFCEQRILVIPNCFENIAPYMEKAQEHGVRIITVGRFVAQKDYLTAIRAVAEVRAKCLNVTFVIVGYGQMENRIRNWMEEYKIAEYTEIFINPNNIRQLEETADIYLSTSLFEGVSNSIMEGMNANLPIVCTDVGDNRNLVEDGVNGYLCTIRDHHAIANALIRLVNDAEKRAAFGFKSKRILSERYNVDRFQSQYSALLN